MTKERLQAVLLLYADKLASDGYEAVKAPHSEMAPFHESDSMRQWLRHAAWMCRETMTFTEENEIEKAMRWLGFIQGVFAVYGYRSIDEMRDDNRLPKGSS